MNRHASMNRAYRLIWSAVRHVWIPVAEKTRGRGKRASPALIAATLWLGASFAQAGGPTGGQVTAGIGSIAQSGALTTITQDSPKLSLSWTSFNIAPHDTVDFVQPSASAIAVNRIFDTNGTQILGHLNANGQVYLINPNGIVFGPGAELNVGGLVATTLDVNGASSDGNSNSFSGSSASAVLNEGTINAAPGGYVALLASHVSNQGVISAQLGSIALAAGSAATLTFSENSLVRLQVDQSVLHSVAENSGLMRADGGQVLMTAGARDALVASAVNNSGVIEAQTVGNHEGTIELLGSMSAGTVHVGGTLDASAPNGGNGGFIETSAAHVEVADEARVTTAAASGLYGSWLIDPQDFTIAASGGDITGAALSVELATTPVAVLSSAGGTVGSGNVNVNDAVSWSANTILTLTASNNVNINANITATGSTAGLIINPNTPNGTETASGTGVYALLSGASITLSGATPSLAIAGIPYTVINTLGLAGSMTGTDLQGINGAPGGYYALGSNINASATSAWNAGAGFTPIGTSAALFTGTFDGLGHTISNLTIYRTSIDGVGLFGYVGNAGVVQNVGIIQASVVGGLDQDGALVGSNYGSVAGSYMTGSVSGSRNSIGGLVGENFGSITGSHAAGIVSAPDNAGGLVGYNVGTISNSYATGAVSGNYDIGGLVGYSSGNADHVYATGAVTGLSGVGGLVGVSSGTFSDSYATGSASGSQAAGLVGINYGTVDHSYATGAVSGGSSLGGLVGINSGGVVTDSYWNTTTSLQATSAGGGTGLTTALMRTASNFVNFIFSITPDAPGNNWVMVDVDGSLNNAGGAAGGTFPMLASEYSTIVTNAHQLQLMAMNVHTNYTLGQNIDASATALAATSGSGDIWSTAGGFIPIGGFHDQVTGSFDGAGYTINDLTISRPTKAYVGLFAVSYAAIQNVGLVGGSVTGETTGALVGLNYGSITNSYATGIVSGSGKTGGLVGINSGTAAITSSYATGNVSGGAYVGGLVGSNSLGTITGSHATGNVSGSSSVGGLVGYAYYGHILSSYAGGTVRGTNNVGGLVGQNADGVIGGSNATGAVTGTGSFVGGLVGDNASDGGIGYSYATGVVTGNANVGGLAGASYGQISNSYATGAVTGTASSVGGLVGINTGVVDITYATGAVMGASMVGGLIGSSSNGLVAASYASGNVSGGDRVGGLIGQNYGAVAQGTISDSYATGVVTGTTNAGGMVGTNIGGFISNSYATGAVTGTTNAGGMVGANNGGIISNSYATGTVTGTTNVGGLVGQNNGGGTILASFATGNVNGDSDVGGLAGYNASGSTIGPSYATGPVSATNTFVGGLVGNNYGAISNSYAAGVAVSTAGIVGGLVGSNDGAISNSYATGGVTGTTELGGLVGANDGSASTVSNSYAAGKVHASTTLGANGGLVGNNAGTITDSFWNSDINAIGIGSGTSTGASGLSTAGMMTMANFSVAGWNIADTGNSGATWRIYDGNTAPLLWIFLTPLTVTAQNLADTYTGAPAAASLTGASYSVIGADTSGHLFNIGNAYEGAINAGSYTPTLYSNQQGYDISFVGGTLTISPATLTVTANAASKIYGQPNPQLSGTVTGFLGTDTLANSTTGSESFMSPAGQGSPVGTYPITAGFTLNNGNYILSAAAGNATALSIDPATLTYTSTAASVAAGQTPTGLSGTLSGFVGTDSEANATAGTLVWTTSATAASPAGRYAIDGGGLTAANYVFVEAPGDATALTLQGGSALSAGSEAATAVGTIEADLPAPQTDMLLLPDVTSDIALALNPDSELGEVPQDLSTNNVEPNKRVLINAMLPSLRIVRGGVKLPDNVVDVNAP